MMNSNSARGLHGSGNAGLTAKRRQAGTTLVEILVVIVVFLIGILAVVQIFPRGFQLLLTTRNNSMATALGREAVERLKGSPELIPDEIVPVTYVNGVPTVNPTINPLSLAPLGDSVDSSGDLTQGGVQVVSDWNLEAGPNVARHIIGEGHRLPASRELGTPTSDPTTQYENYGGLLVLDHNPIDPGPNPTTAPTIVAYGNELSRTEGGPLQAAFVDPVSIDSATTPGIQVVLANGNTVTLPDTNALGVTTPVATVPFQFFTTNSDSSGAAILLPALTTADRTYRIRLSAYVGTGAGVTRVDYTALSILVPRIRAATSANPPQNPPQLVQVSIQDVLNAEGVLNGQTLYAVEADSIRVAPEYHRVPTWSTAVSEGTGASYQPVDPFEMKVVDPYLGVLLFSPAARNGVVTRPGGISEPLLARVDYDVRDWRVIGEDFRLTNNDVLTGADHTVSLSLQSLKVGSSQGPDGLPNGGIFTADRKLLTNETNTDTYDPVSSPRDNVVIVDLTTGYEVQRYRTTSTDGTGRTHADVAAPATNSNGPDVLVSVDKSRGSITFHDALVGNAVNGVDPLDVVLIPPTGAPITVSAANRTFRVLYRARQEWAVQTLKGASQYTLVSSFPAPANFAPDQAFVGDGTNGTGKTRIYFAPSQVGTKVTIDRIDYTDASGNPQVLEGQDFVINAPKATETGYPYVDITDVLGTGSNVQFSTLYAGAPVQGIKGASVSVRVLWNPDAFSLSTSTDPTVNLALIGQYDRGWRKSTTETYLRAEETR